MNNKKQSSQSINRNGHSIPCNSKSNNLCCTQVQLTNTSKCLVTIKVFNLIRLLLADELFECA